MSQASACPSRGALRISVLLLAAAMAAAATQPVDPLYPFLVTRCGIRRMPAAGSLAGFMGQMQRLNTTKTSYAYYRFGNTTSTKPPLILIAGIGNTISFWPPSFLQLLARTQEVIVYDNPGVGYSEFLEPPSSGLTIEGMAADAVEFFDKLDLPKKPNVWGQSMGGAIATAMAANHGSRVNKVVVAPGTAGSPNSEQPDAAFTIAVLSGQVTLLDWLNASYPLNTEKGLKEACWDMRQRAAANQHPQNPMTANMQLAALQQWWMGPGAYDKLPGITTPMLMVGGLKDIIIPAQNLRVIANRVPRSWMVLYDQASHEAMIQERVGLIPIVANFFDNA